MALVAGTRLGPYEVISAIGAGGMGEVYRARDTRLERNVALKVLPEVFAQDTERMLRFQREAQVLASLNHQHIAAIYGLEHQDKIQALAMELVAGQTLAERISNGAIPLEEALPIAKQIAEALEYAHERGIIHRDLKPANVVVTGDGNAKVLDFGLAKALSDDVSMQDASHSPTLSMAATEAGIILGTPAYMSPEQARGKPADRRSDIWSLGVVFYEMISGRQIFAGETASDSMAAVITLEPDWNALPANVPPRLRELLRRCLKKDPRRRLQAVGEARILIEDELSGTNVPTPIAGTGETSKRRPWMALIVAMAITAAVTAAIFLLVQPRAQGPVVRKFSIAVPDLLLGIQTPPVISPDGKKIAYVASAGLWVRELDRMEAQEIVARVSPHYPMWSPDSSQLAYLAGQRLWRVAATGGQPVVVSAATFALGGSTPGGTWTDDGRIIFAQAASVSPSELLFVSDQGGDFKELLARDDKTESDLHKPSLLPDGKGLLFIVDHNDGGADTIEALSGQTRKTIWRLKNEYLDAPVYSPTGHILYRRNTGNAGIWAVPFSLSDLKTTGEPFLVVGDANWPSVASDGTLLYSDEGESLHQTVLLNRKGESEGIVGEPKAMIRNPRFSPDGSRLTFFEGITRSEGGIYVRDLRRRMDVRLTFTNRMNLNPAWSPGGDRVFYESRKGGAAPEIYARSADGSGNEDLIVKEGTYPCVSPDGKWLAYSAIIPTRGLKLFYMPLEGDHRPMMFLDAPGEQRNPVFSPDGRYVAYESNESGRYEILLKTFPKGEGKWQVSTNGGTTARWDRGGKKLYFVQGDTLMEVDVATQPTLLLETPRALFSAVAKKLRLDFSYDISPDGKLFAVVQDATGDKTVVRSVHLVENWFAEFKNKQKK